MNHLAAKEWAEFKAREETLTTNNKNLAQCYLQRCEQVDRLKKALEEIDMTPRMFRADSCMNEMWQKARQALKELEKENL